MRADLLTMAFAALVVSLEPFEEPPGRLAQTGPLPTAAVNPRLGAPPPGGHLGESGRAPAVAPDVGAVPVDPTRPDAAAASRLGTPPAAAVPNAATGAVPPPAGRAVPPPAGR